MEFKIKVTDKPEGTTPLAVFTFTDRLLELPEFLKTCKGRKRFFEKMVEYGEIKGEVGEAPYYLPCECEGPSRVFFIGLGDSEKSSMETFRKAGASLCRRLRRFKVPNLDIMLPEFPDMDANALKRNIQAFIVGFLLRGYSFTKYIMDADEGTIDQVRFLEPDDTRLHIIESGVKLGHLFGDATNLCRDISNEPANVMTPVIMAERAEEIASRSERISVEIYDESQIIDMGMGLFKAVGQSSSVPPRLIVMHYDSGIADAPTIGLVGKGVTFDSGGISIKGAADMFHMKRDMSGGAAVMAVFHAVAMMDLNVNIAGVVGATENMVGSKAYKPGDILRSLDGKTVEVINTDAEGRLLLGDLMTYIQRRWDLECMVDIATLTGSISQSLGRNYSGIMTNSDDLYQRLNHAAEDSNDKIWRLPLEEEYRKHIKTPFADIKNLGSGAPGSVLAALFLEEFVESGVSWAHLDIAGTGTHYGKPTTYYVRGATGVGTRLLLEFILETSKSPNAICATTVQKLSKSHQS